MQLPLLAAVALLTACATGTSELRPQVCPSYFTYDQKTLDQAADEYEGLPEGGLRVLIDDYKVVRGEMRAIGCS